MEDPLRSLTFIKSEGYIVYCEDHITICKKNIAQTFYLGIDIEDMYFGLESY